MQRRTLLAGSIPLLLGASALGADKAPPAPLSISIAIGKRGGKQRNIEYRDEHSHFSVVIRNDSDKPQRIWREWCSWGYYLINFKTTDVDGKSGEITRPLDKEWTVNFPDCEEIAPTESIVRDIYFGGDTWEKFPRGEKPNGHRFQLQAIFECKADKETAEFDVWTGKALSPPLDVFLFGLK